MEFKDDIDFLVHQTFNNPEFFNSTESSAKIPNAVGLIYGLDVKSSMFVLKTLPSVDLSQDMPKIQADSSDFSWHYFKTENIEESEYLSLQFKGRRYPLYEENIINISDPSSNVWFRSSARGLELFFTLAQTDQMENLTRLGPIFESLPIEQLFLQYRTIFKQMIPNCSISCSRFKFEMSSKYYSEYIEDFIQLFKNGVLSLKLSEHLDFLVDTCVLETSSLLEFRQFLNTTALKRRFWRDLEQHLY